MQASAVVINWLTSMNAVEVLSCKEGVFAGTTRGVLFGSVVSSIK
jgi:hypothetical protein